MYKRVRLIDTVEVPPAHLADVTPQRVKHLLQEKLEGRMDEDVGSVVSVIEVREIGEGTVLPRTVVGSGRLHAVRNASGSSVIGA